MDVSGLEVIKAFISSVKEYNTQRTEAVSQKLQRYLQILSSISDNSVFDPNNTDGAEFYASLYDLMSKLDSRTGLMWCAVSVLEEASKNPSAHYALVNIHKFTPILTQLLSGHLIHDKQVKVLRLLKEFTYGVKILWQDANLPLLISILIKWIKDNDKGSEIVSLSLGILVNLCYKNLPAIYALRRVIDIKEFIKSILAQAKDILDIRVQAFKMLIILEEVSGEMTDNGIMSCIAWTFNRIYEAFESGNVNAMRHLVDFFKDIKENGNFIPVLHQYPSYSADTEKLLRLVESKYDVIEDSDCLTLLLDFIEHIILLETPDMERLYEPLVKLTLTLCDSNPKGSQVALQVICTVMSLSRKNGKTIHLSIINKLDNALPVLLSSLNIADSVRMSDKNTMTALLGLLLELSKEPAICKKILSFLQPADMKSYFLHYITPNSSENEYLFDEPSASFYVQGLSLVSSLSSVEDNWSSLLSELMQQKKLKMKLAASIYSGSPQVKCQALKLISQLSKDNRLLMELSQCMSELDKLVAPVVSTGNINGFNLNQNHSFMSASEHCASPLLSLAQQSRLDQCIATVQQAISNNQFGSVGTAAVLELYEYRVAAMSHTESVLQGNLQAVDNYCTQLRHRVSIMTSEMNKLLSVLHNKEESLETSQAAVNNLQRDLIATESSLQISQDRCNQAIQDLKAKSKVVEELSSEIQRIKIVLNEKQQENVMLTDEIKIFKSRCKEYDDVISLLNKDVESKEETIKQKQKDLQEMASVIQSREKKIEQKETLIKSLEKSVCDKNDEIAQYQAEIAELEAMRDTILKVTMDKEKKIGKRK